MEDIEKKPKGLSQVKGEVILAHGEATGHAHRIVGAKAKLYEKENERILILPEEDSLVHQEHETIRLPKGTKRVIRQREYSPEQIRNVAD